MSINIPKQALEEFCAEVKRRFSLFYIGDIGSESQPYDEADLLEDLTRFLEEQASGEAPLNLRHQDSVEFELEKAVYAATRPIIEHAQKTISDGVKREAISCALGELERSVIKLLEGAGYRGRSYSEITFGNKVIISGDKRRPGNEFVVEVVKHLLDK